MCIKYKSGFFCIKPKILSYLSEEEKNDDDNGKKSFSLFFLNNARCVQK